MWRRFLVQWWIQVEPIECCNERIRWSTGPRRNVPRTKRMMKRSKKARRAAPLCTMSGRSAGAAGCVRSDIFEHDVDVAGRGQMWSDGVEDVFGEVLVIDR